MQARKGWICAIGLGLLLSVSAMTGAQDLYRWVDANGNVHYSDQPPPPGARDIKALGRSSGESARPSSTAAASDSYTEKEAEFQRRRAAQAEEEAKAQQAEATRQRNCEVARSNFNTVAGGGRVTRRNAAGEVEFLDEEELERESERARAEIEKWCDA